MPPLQLLGRPAFALSAGFLVAALACASSTHQPGVDAEPPFALRPGVIVDSNRGAAYVGNPNGSIEAVDLTTGRALWTSNAAALPLAADGRVLVAQAEETPPASRLRVIVLDVDGRKTGESVFDLPSEVLALVADDLNRRFRVTAERDQNGFLLRWSYRETLVQGIARAPGEAPPERARSGTVHLDAKGASRRRPANVKASKRPRGAENALVTLPSADGKHLLVSRRVGAGGPSDPEYQWSIVALESGEPIGQVRLDVSAASFFIWKDRVVFQSQPHGFLGPGGWVDVPLEVRAIRLATGKPAWSRAIRDLEYRGERPPLR